MAIQAICVNRKASSVKRQALKKLVIRYLVAVVTVLLAAGYWLLAPAYAGEPTRHVKEGVDKIIEILKDERLKKPEFRAERRTAIRRVVNEKFDFEEMAKRALGIHWRARTSEERKEFVVLFSNLLERSYINRIEGYADEEIIYTGERIDGEYADVDTKIITKRAVEIPIRYRLLKENNRWYVYDVVIEGVYTDLYSQWTVRAGGYGKNLQSVTEIDKIAHEKIPFDCLHYHPDNDKTILKTLFERVRENPVIKLSRSRPYKKNDNAHVEQKGGDKVRKLIGYFRFDTEIEVRLLNEIYKQADLIDNYFIACAKLKEKVKDSKGKTIKKVYEPPMTPYQRLMLCDEVSDELKRRLKKIYGSLNMVKLKQEMDMLIEKLINLKLGIYAQTKKKFHGQKLLSIQQQKTAFQEH